MTVAGAAWPGWTLWGLRASLYASCASGISVSSVALGHVVAEESRELRWALRAHRSAHRCRAFLCAQVGSRKREWPPRWWFKRKPAVIAEHMARDMEVTRKMWRTARVAVPAGLFVAFWVFGVMSNPQADALPGGHVFTPVCARRGSLLPLCHCPRSWWSGGGVCSTPS